MNIKKTLGILTLSALSYVALGCEPQTFSQPKKTAVVQETPKAEFPKDNKGIVQRPDYIVETDFDKGTMKFYQNGTNREFAAEFTTDIPASLKDKPEQARAYASAITNGLDMLISHGRNTAHKEQLESTETDDFTARTQYTGKEVVETYFHNLDGKDGSIDGRISAEEFGPKKLQKWLNMSDEEFRQEFPLHVDASSPSGYGGIRKPTFQELLDKERQEGNAMIDSLRKGKCDSEKARTAYDAAARAFNREYEVKAAAEKARYEAGKR